MRLLEIFILYVWFNSISIAQHWARALTVPLKHTHESPGGLDKMQSLTQCVWAEPGILHFPRLPVILGLWQTALGMAWSNRGSQSV